MTHAAEEVLHQALELPVEDRARIAHELIVSLDGEDDPDADAAWAAEIQRRATAWEKGEVKGSSWSDVEKRVNAVLK